MYLCVCVVCFCVCLCAWALAARTVCVFVFFNFFGGTIIKGLSRVGVGVYVVASVACATVQVMHLS